MEKNVMMLFTREGKRGGLSSKAEKAEAPFGMRES